MDKEFSKACLRTALLSFAVITCAILFYNVITNLSDIYGAILHLFSVFDSIIIGFVFAYILNTPIGFLKRIFSKFIKKEKLRTSLAVTVTYIIVVMVIFIFVWHLIPALTNNIVYFASNVNGYLDSFSGYIEDFSQGLPARQRLLGYFYSFVYEVADIIKSWFTGNFMSLVGVVFKTTDIILTFIVSFVISIYMSLSCDTLVAQIKKTLFALFPKKFCKKTIYALRAVNESFSSYLSGVFVSAVIIGFLCWALMALCNLHYAPLISFIVMLTDVIPYFGPFIGAAVGAVLLLLVDPWDALWFLIIVIALQQLTSNIINPGIIGKATGLDSIYVILSIIIMGGIFGVPGMIVGVPIFVILFKAIRKFIATRTKEVSDEEPIQQ